MRDHIQKLYEISRKPSRKIIGLMSGTSLDGLDIAVCEISGHGEATKLRLEKFLTYSYNDEFKTKIKKIFSKKSIELELLTLLNKHIAYTHARLVNKALKEWEIDPNTIDLLASHGQTIYHAPFSLHGVEEYGNATLQIGDGDHLSFGTGIITVSDFRQKHIAAGGEGAPLAAYGDFLIFSDADSNVILLNIGGISNFTFLPKANDQRLMFSTDLGPGNTMMDAWVQLNYPGKAFDEDALIAQKGIVNQNLLAALKDNSFLNASLPRTTGPELFNLEYLSNAQLHSGSKIESSENVLATLNRFTADIIIDNINSITHFGNAIIYASGGGIHNPLLMQTLEENIHNVEWRSTTDKGVDPDAKEAVLFALLANETIAGNYDSFRESPNFPSVSMGKISLPR